MHDAFEFLKALTTVLGVAAVVTVVFQRLRQPVVLGYVIAGLIIGPHVPVPLVADPEIVRTLSELGVILLMFSLGLEFSIHKLIQVGPRAGITAVVETSLMMWLGFMVGRALHFSALESLFTGAIVAISSTTIIAKAFDEQRIQGTLREFVVGILVVEDLIAVVWMATLTAISSGARLSAGALAWTAGRLLAFLAALVVVGLLVVPRLIRTVVRLNRPETTLISAVAVCFGVALLAHAVGYSVALGAFIAGSLVSESGEEKTVARLVAPVRDMFAAIFFVSVGLMIDPSLVVRHWVAVALIAAVVIVGKIAGVTLGAFLTGNGVRTSVQSGMTLAQIGEFSFIIAALGLRLRVTGDFLYPVAVSVSALTTLSTPWLIRGSSAWADFVDRRLPRPLQTFAALYGTWLEGLGTASRQPTWGAEVRRLARLALLDALIVAGLAILAAVSSKRVVDLLRTQIPLSPAALRWLVVLAAVALCLPFVAGLGRVGRRLAVLLGDAALPRAREGKPDLALAPRRMLVAAVQLTIVVLVGVPMVAITQPFLPGTHVAVGLGLVLVALLVGFWRSARNLQGHVRAGAQVIAEALKAQSRDAVQPSQRSLVEIHALLPGLGAPISVALDAASFGVGKTLAELNLRGATGATVLAIHRAAGDVLVPGAGEVLSAGDVVALAGTEAAIAQAKQLLTGAAS
jgi:monovalent cation:H+ antiporter-2, CPA2 family